MVVEHAVLLYHLARLIDLVYGLLYSQCPSSHACPAPAYLTSPPTHPPPPARCCPSITPWGAPWLVRGGGPVTRVMSGTYVLFRGHSGSTIGFAREVQLVWVGCKCRCLSQNTLLPAARDAALPTLAASRREVSEQVKVPTIRPARRPVHFFPFLPTVTSFFPITGFRGRALIYCRLFLLSPSSSRTRNLLRPARLNLSFFFGHGDQKGRGNFYRNPFPPATLPKRETHRGPCPL